MRSILKGVHNKGLVVNVEEIYSAGGEDDVGDASKGGKMRGEGRPAVLNSVELGRFRMDKLARW